MRTSPPLTRLFFKLVTPTDVTKKPFIQGHFLWGKKKKDNGAIHNLLIHKGDKASHKNVLGFLKHTVYWDPPVSS